MRNIAKIFTCLEADMLLFLVEEEGLLVELGQAPAAAGGCAVLWRWCAPAHKNELI